MNALANSPGRRAGEVPAVRLPARAASRSPSPATPGRSRRTSAAGSSPTRRTSCSTNYVMLELVLTRPDERKHLVRAAQGLRFLVLDELHTYRGRQGADVAMLVRRLRDQCAADDLQVDRHQRHDGQRRHRRRAAGGRRRGRHPAVRQPRSPRSGSSARRWSAPPRRRRPTTGRAARGGRRGRSGRALPFDARVTGRRPAGRLGRDDVRPRRRGRTPAGSSAARRPPCPQAAARAGRAHRRQPRTTARRRCATSCRPARAVTAPGHRPAGVRVPAAPVPVQGRHRLRLPRARGRPGTSPAPTRSASRSSPRRRCCRSGSAASAARSTSSSPRPRATARASSSPAATPTPAAATASPATSTSAATCPGPTTRWPPGGCPTPGWSPTRRPTGSRSSTASGSTCRTRSALRPDGALDDDRQRPAGVVRVDAVRVLPALRRVLRAGPRQRLRQARHPRRRGPLQRGDACSAPRSSAALRGLDPSELDPTARKLLTFVDNRQDASLQAGHFNDFVQVAQLRGALYRALAAAGADGLTHEDVAAAVTDALGLRHARLRASARTRSSARRPTPSGRCAASSSTSSTSTCSAAGGSRCPTSSRPGCCTSPTATWPSSPPTRSPGPARYLLDQVSAEQREELARILLDELRRVRAIDVDCLTEDGFDRLKQLTRAAPRSSRGRWPRTSGWSRSASRIPRPARAGGRRARPRRLRPRRLRPLPAPRRRRPARHRSRTDDADAGHRRPVRASSTGAGLLDPHRRRRTGPDYRLNAGALRWLAGDGKHGRRRPAAQGVPAARRPRGSTRSSATSTATWPRGYAGHARPRAHRAGAAGRAARARATSSATASCRCCTARRRWSSASTSATSTPSACATSRRRRPTTPSAPAAPAAAASRRWCSPTAPPATPTTATGSAAPATWSPAR